MNIPGLPPEIESLDLMQKFDPLKLKRAFHNTWKAMRRSINGRLYFGDPQSQSKGFQGNLDGVWPGVASATYTILTPGVANTEFTVTHNLGRIPTGYDVKGLDQAAIIYDSRKNAWTTTQMFLKCNLASVNTILFVH